MQADQLTLLAIVGALCGAVALLLALLALRTARSARHALAALLDEEASSREGTGLTRALDGVRSHTAMLTTINERLDLLEHALPSAISRLGLTHFQAFEDVGGGQSSAIALLDDHGDGAVITTIHSRTGTRMYVKRITAGRGESAIGGEEAAAVAEALALPRPATKR